MFSMFGRTTSKARDKNREAQRKKTELRLGQITSAVCRRGDENHNCSPFHPCHDNCPVIMPPVPGAGR